jgi:hypothetical protein
MYIIVLPGPFNIVPLGCSFLPSLVCVRVTAVPGRSSLPSFLLQLLFSSARTHRRDIHAALQSSRHLYRSLGRGHEIYASDATLPDGNRRHEYREHS